MRINGKGANGYNAHGQAVRRNVGLRDKVDDFKGRIPRLEQKRVKKIALNAAVDPVISLIVMRDLVLQLQG